MHLLLALLLLLPTVPRSPTQEKKLQEEGARELTRRMQSDDNFQRGRLLAQAVAHYRIAVSDYVRAQGGDPAVEDLVHEGYLLSWASAGTRPVALQPKSADTRNFRLLMDGDLPDFAYLSYGLEHPEGEGEWQTNWRWVSTNIGMVKNLAEADRTPYAGRRRGIEIQLAAPIELTYVFTRQMPKNYATACQLSRLAPLSTTPGQEVVAGLTLWVQPAGNRYAIAWDESDGSRTTTVYGYAPSSIDAAKVGTELAADFVQIWPIPASGELLSTVGAEQLIEQMKQVVPKNEGQPGKVDITPIPMPLPPGSGS